MTLRDPDIEFLKHIAESERLDPPMKSIVDFIEARRIMPSGAPKPGPFKFSWTPYLREMQECLSPTSPIQEIAVMKSAQLGFTEVLLNTIGFYIAECSSNILYVSSTGDLLERFSAEKLEPMIDSLGIRKLFIAPINTDDTESMTRRGGDKVLLKHYPGGTLALASLNSLASLRSASVRILLLDEIDGVKFTSPEGSATNVAKARTDAYGHLRKIVYVSTPTVNNTSLIARLYERGDQRKYFIPCAHCGEFIELHMRNLKRVDGQAVYFCDKCGAAIEEYQKKSMESNGEWRATVISKQGPLYRSYHMNSLYSPTLSWDQILREYDTAKEEGEESMRAFINLRRGEPFRETGERPRIDKVISMRGTRPEKEVPEFILYNTMSVDVQSGGKDTDSRLCINVVGHGSKMRKAILKYHEIVGAIDNPYEGAWKEFYDMASGGEYNYSRRSDGLTFPIQLAAIDSGDGNLTGVVFDFCKRLGPSVFPLKGFAKLGNTRVKKYMWVTQSNAATSQRNKLNTNVDASKERYLQINTTYYKNAIYNQLQVRYEDNAEFQKYGFIEFNKDLHDNYFKMLVAEEKNREGAFINPSGKRNESLDCLVYNFALADFWLETKAVERAQSIKVVLMELHKHRRVACDLQDVA
jgi:phage terminase large subunit GpA-like protein